MSKTQTPKPAKTQQPAKPESQAKQASQEVSKSPEATNPPIEPEKAAVDTSTAEGVQTQSDETNGPQTLNTDATEGGSKESLFVRIMQNLLNLTEDQTEKEALGEIILLAKAFPDQEAAFMEALQEEYRTQYNAAMATKLVPMPEFEKGGEMPWPEEKSEEDIRAERIRANAQAELDLLYEQSRERQKAAEALAEKAQPDRRENLE